jgi:hypothetical protein
MIRNTLGRWRLAAVELYNFPLELPVTLHICPEEERDKWIAEIDLDPAYKVNFAIFFPVLRIWLRDPVPFLTPGSGIRDGKQSGSGSGMNKTRIIFPKL